MLPRLIAITDLGIAAETVLVERFQQLALQARPGSVALLLRDHAFGARQRLVLGKQLRSIADRARQAFWVADRLDLALLLRADGVHLGEASVRAGSVRRVVGAGVHISRAWHAASLTDAASEEVAEVDALLVSPIFSPRKGRPEFGLPSLGALGEQLRARKWGCKIYALGGVSPKNAAACLDAGTHGVAAIGAALREDPRPLLSALDILR